MNKSLKIMVVNWRDPLHPEAGGAEKHLDKVLTYLALHHTVLLITTRTKKQCELFQYNGYTIYGVGHPYFFDYHFCFSWKEFIKIDDFDILIEDISKIPMALSSYIKTVPILVFFHHMHAKSLFRAVKFPIVALYLYIIEYLRMQSYKDVPIITVSHSSYQELCQSISSTNIYIIPNGVDDDLLDIQSDAIRKTPFQLCILTRLVATKRLDLSIKVFQKVRQAYPQAILKIAGSGRDEKKLKQYVKTLSLEKSIIFLSHVTEEEKKELLTSSEAMIITSEKEGWGIAAMEASACGTPVFAFRVPGIMDSVIHGINGYLSEFNAIDNLAEQIKLYFASSEDYKQKIQESSISLAKQYHWNPIVQDIEEIIKNLLFEIRI